MKAILDAGRNLGFAVVPIATTDFGDLVYLRPGPAEGDEVCVTYHDGDTEILADSVEAMAAALRGRRGPRYRPRSAAVALTSPKLKSSS